MWWGAIIDDSLEALWLSEKLAAAGGVVFAGYSLSAVGGKTRLYKSICPSDLRGRHTLAASEAEAKRLVVANCG